MADAPRRAPDIFAGPKGKRVLDEDAAARKHGIYESLGKRGKTYVDGIGYDAWDPCQEPKDPLDIRTDATRRTTRQLVRRFLQEHAPADGGGVGNAYGQGVLECALGIVNKDETFRGIFEFCIWYEQLLRQEGHGSDESPL
jgi:hypothetical protein